MCKKCCYKSAIFGHVRDHIVRKHLESAALFPCTLCERSFKTANDRQKHYKKIHDVKLTSKEIQELEYANFQ